VRFAGAIRWCDSLVRFAGAIRWCDSLVRSYPVSPAIFKMVKHLFLGPKLTKLEEIIRKNNLIEQFCSNFVSFGPRNKCFTILKMAGETG
jgi:hypothetical protein